MAFTVPVSVYLLFHAMTALTEEAARTITPTITTQQSNWTVNKTEAVLGSSRKRKGYSCFLFWQMKRHQGKPCQDSSLRPESMLPPLGKLESILDVISKAAYTEGHIALRFSHPCLEDHNSYCINGVCAFHHELEKAICRCFTGYTGERCEHLTLTSYAMDSYEKYIAIGIGVGLLLSGFLAIFYCYIRKRCLNLKSPYNVCSGGRPL